MTPKRQTVWLASLLGILIVLSVYYLVTDPAAEVKSVSSSPMENPMPNAHSMSNGEEGANPAAGAVDEKEGSAPVSFSSGQSQGDFFLNYRLQREVMKGERTEQLMNIIASDASAEAIAEAQRQLNELSKMEVKQMNAEEMIRLEGYQDAVVLASDNHVNVIVQGEAMSKGQALKIYRLVADQLGVPMSNITLSLKK